MLKGNKILTVTFFVVAGAFIIYALVRRHKFEKFRQMTSGQITQCQIGGWRHPPNTLFVEFKFHSGDKVYYGATSTVNVFSRAACDENLVGRNFPVLFEESWGMTSTILITPKQFAYYGYGFPDSLKWILPLIIKDHE